MRQLGSLQYTMTLQGPRRAPVGLLGVLDPFTLHPWLLGLGLATGIFLGSRRR